MDAIERPRVRLAAPSVWDAYLSLLAARGLPAGSGEQILASFQQVAGDRAAHDDLCQPALRWRLRDCL